MNYFLKQLLIFLLFPFFLLLTIEISISLYKKNIFSEKSLELNYKEDANQYAWIESLKSDSIIILAGSSSVRYGLSCSILNELDTSNSVYVSIAMDARDPIQTYFILKNMDLNRVSSVYFGLDPWIYSKRYYQHRNSYLYLDLNVFESILYHNLIDKNVFLTRYEQLINFLNNTQTSHMRTNIITPQDFGYTSLKSKAINFEATTDFFELEKYGWSELQFEYLAKIESICQSKNIGFSLFIPPKRSDYSAIYKEKYQDTHTQYMQKLSKYNIHSPIFGKYNILDGYGDSTLFVESYHLNEKGQAKFSKIFYDLSKKKSKSFSPNYSWYE